MDYGPIHTSLQKIHYEAHNALGVGAEQVLKERFKKCFLEAFLPTDYQSEIDEQIKTNVQAPTQCLRDFAYDHRAQSAFVGQKVIQSWTWGAPSPS